MSTDKIEQVVRQTIRKFRASARLAGADLDDLYQQGWAEAIPADAGYDSSRGVEYGAWITWVVRKAVVRAILKAGSPVSSARRPRNLIGFHKHSGYGVNDLLHGLDSVLLDADRHEHPSLDPLRVATHRTTITKQTELNAAVLEVAGRVRERIRALISSEEGMNDLVVDLLSKEVKPGELAREAEMPVQTLKNQMVQWRKILREDEELQELWEELQ